MDILSEQILHETSIFQTINLANTGMKACAEKCRRAIKNNKDYQRQVSVCTSKCKILQLSKTITVLQKMKGSGVSDQSLDTKISYLIIRRNKEMAKLQVYGSKLRARQNVIPVDLSLRPSPERPESRKSI